MRKLFVTNLDDGAEGLRQRNGQVVEVLRCINDESDDPDHEYDPEVLPMYWVRFPDGYESAAFPEELQDFVDDGPGPEYEARFAAYVASLREQQA